MGMAPQGPAQTPVAEGGGLGIEPAPPGPQPAPGGPQQGSIQAQLLAAYNARQPVGISAGCDLCLDTLTSPAWYNPQDGRWLQGHQCVKAGRYRTNDVTDIVKQTVGVQ